MYLPETVTRVTDRDARALLYNSTAPSFRIPLTYICSYDFENTEFILNKAFHLKQIINSGAFLE